MPRKNHEEALAYSRWYKRKHRAQIRRQQKQYREDKKYYETPAEREERKARQLEYQRQYKLKHPERYVNGVYQPIRAGRV